MMRHTLHKLYTLSVLKSQCIFIIRDDVYLKYINHGTNSLCMSSFNFCMGLWHAQKVYRHQKNNLE